MRPLPYASELLAAGYLDDAIAYTEENRAEIMQDPAYPRLVESLVNELVAKDNLERAAEVTVDAAAHSPDLLAQAGIMLMRAGHPTRAAAQFRRAIEHNQSDPVSHHYLSLILDEQGDAANALTHATAAVESAPGFIEARRHLGWLLDRAEREPEAMPHYRAVIAARPENAVITWMVWILATHPDDVVRDGDEAVSLAEAVYEATAGNDLGIRLALAVAYAEAGRFQDAVAITDDTLKIARENNIDSLIKTLEEHREVFMNGEVVRMR